MVRHPFANAQASRKLRHPPLKREQRRYLGLHPFTRALQKRGQKASFTRQICPRVLSALVASEYFFITAEKGGVVKAKGEGEKEKECTTECKSRRRRDEKAPWALNYGSFEG
jgi:hypothetical protein